MKTATVRDLRNNFAEASKWIEHGEQVSITRNGAVFATLAPAEVSKPAKVDWKAPKPKQTQGLKRRGIPRFVTVSVRLMRAASPESLTKPCSSRRTAISEKAP